ncbi:hypothetical protein HHK36_028044 [Tetracentron sinense]|uniref:threonine--tRNA ligase n=1 Tax=Tetracentron sinense TaxID=13715 RepID=A0A834YE67_TETSI|nr:hypothetical protein HHK36_028044 [Tetracentron sinense]
MFFSQAWGTTLFSCGRRVSSSYLLIYTPLRILSSTAAAARPAMGETPDPKLKPYHSKDEAYLQEIIPKRISLFESIKAQQIEERQRIGGESIKYVVTLPDGTVKEGKKWITSPLDIAKGISKSLAASALISQVNGILWDMLRPLEGDCELKLFTFDTDEGRDTFWHSSAHILGQSLEMEYGCKLCIGPCTTRGEVWVDSNSYWVGLISEGDLIDVNSIPLPGGPIKKAMRWTGEGPV